MSISLKTIIGLLIFILVVHVIATINHWYWTYQWFDIPMHFLGGALVAMVFLYLNPNFKIQNQKFTKLPNYLITIIITLSFVSLIGVLWELFEFLLDVFVVKTGYLSFPKAVPNTIMNTYDIYRDTLGDLFFDLLGGFAMAAIFQFRKSKDRFPRDNKPE